MFLLLPLLLLGAPPSLFLLSSQHQSRPGAVSFLSFVPLFVSTSLSLLFSSFFTISLFFILFLFEMSSSLSTDNDDAEIEETFEDGFKKRLTVHFPVLRL